MTRFCWLCSFVGDHSALEEGQYVLMANYTAYPYSRGSMHITGPDINDALDFDVGFFSDPGDIDLKKQVWAYKKQREFMRRTQMFRGEVALGHPKFSPTSKAALVEDVSTLDLRREDVQDLEYSAEDDKAIEQFLRENIQTTVSNFRGTTCPSQVGTPTESGLILIPALKRFDWNQLWRQITSTQCPTLTLFRTENSFQCFEN